MDKASELAPYHYFYHELYHYLSVYMFFLNYYFFSILLNIKQLYILYINISNCFVTLVVVLTLPWVRIPCGTRMWNNLFSNRILINVVDWFCCFSPGGAQKSFIWCRMCCIRQDVVQEETRVTHHIKYHQYTSEDSGSNIELENVQANKDVTGS